MTEKELHMTDQVINTSSTNSGSAKLVYILYLAGIVFGITGLIGVIMAYINKSDAPEWLQTANSDKNNPFVGEILTIMAPTVSIKDHENPPWTKVS